MRLQLRRSHCSAIQRFCNVGIISQNDCYLELSVLAAAKKNTTVHVSIATAGRPARIYSQELGQYLKSNGLLGNNNVWLPLYGDSSGVYYWYGDSTASVGGAVDTTTFADAACKTVSAGGPMYIYGGYCNGGPNDINTLMCECKR